ncbi:MAG: relaxase/mobilization nuclease domain-containing protein [Bacteroidales bacterium]
MNYVFDGMPSEKEKQWVIFRNITSGFSQKSITKEFDDNAKLLPKNLKRSKTIRYHEVLAFSHLNSNDLTRDKLQAIAHKYLQLRDPEQSSIVVCVPHTDKHTHIHVLMSSNAIGSNKSSDRMMTNEFYYSLRRDMEKWVLSTYPELHHSTVYLPENEILELIPEKFHEERKLLELDKSKTKRNTVKDRLSKRIKDILEKSRSLKDFQERINRMEGLQTYARKGELTGVILENKTKFRFKNLGINLLKEKFSVLARMSELEAIMDRQSDHSFER